MSQYKLLRDVLFNDQIHPAGQVVELDDSAAEPYVERGSIALYDEDAEAQAALPEVIEGKVVEEYEFNGFCYKKILALSGGYRYTQDDVEVDASAYENELQRKVATVGYNPVQETEEVTTDQSDGPTPEEIAAIAN